VCNDKVRSVVVEVNASHLARNADSNDADRVLVHSMNDLHLSIRPLAPLPEAEGLGPKVVIFDLPSEPLERANGVQLGVRGIDDRMANAIGNSTTGEQAQQGRLGAVAKNLES